MQFWKTQFSTYGGTYGGYNQIIPVEVERASESSVWINGRRVARHSGGAAYFDTWDAAHAHLLGAAELNLTHARNQLNQAQGVHGNIKGLKPPVTA